MVRACSAGIPLEVLGQLGDDVRDLAALLADVQPLAAAQDGVRPCRYAALTLALSSSSDSLWYSRRSLCPTTA